MFVILLLFQHLGRNFYSIGFTFASHVRYMFMLFKSCDFV